MGTVLNRYVSKSNLINLGQLGSLKTPLIGSFTANYSFEDFPSYTMVERAIPPSQLGEPSAGGNFGGQACYASSTTKTLNSVLVPGVGRVEAYDISTTYTPILKINFEKTVTVTPEKGLRYVTLAQIAKQAGINIGSADACRIYLADGEKNVKTSLSNHMSKVRLLGQFINWSGSGTAPEALTKDVSTASVSDSNVIYPLSVTVSPAPIYKKTPISWEFSENINGAQFVSDISPFDQNRLLDEALDRQYERLNRETLLTKLIIQYGKYAYVSPVQTSKTEGDADIEKPPAGNNIVEDLSSNWDQSGPKKTRKITKYSDGQPISETVDIYGFVYTSLQIATSSISEVPLRGSIGGSWQHVESSTTTYNYEHRLQGISADVVVGKNTVVPLNDLGTNLNNQNPLYLTSVTTVGWRLARYKQEELGGNYDLRVINERLLEDGLDGIDIEYYEACRSALLTFRQSFTSTTKYYIVNSNGISSASLAPPFTVERIKKSKKPKRPALQYKIDTLEENYERKLQIELREKNQIYREELEEIDANERDLSGFTGDSAGYVYFKIPNQDYYTPYLVIREETSARSFSSRANPENIYLRRDRAEEDDPIERAKIKLLPDLSVGTDTLNRTFRETYSKSTGDGYTEYVAETVYQEAGFRNVSEDIRYNVVTGLPPEASVIKGNFKRIDNYTERKYPPKRPKSSKHIQSEQSFEYTLNSTGGSFESPIIGSVSYDTRIQSQALTAANTDLSISQINSENADVNLAWYYPQIKDGQTFSYPGGSGVVKSSSYTLDFHGLLDGKPFITCSGTHVSVGGQSGGAATISRLLKTKNTIVGEDAEKLGAAETEYRIVTHAEVVNLIDKANLGEAFASFISRTNR